MGCVGESKTGGARRRQGERRENMCREEQGWSAITRHNNEWRGKSGVATAVRERNGGVYV